ncbi:hypothetical protein [Streptomyces ziwulingensis]|uniref:LexA repressor DNA-binding domain-containing protein n=1 Tax=Streptomyces ziwulingensis TaxID=1045501 RepID=A0ABP9AM81_9ACTN
MSSNDAPIPQSSPAPLPEHALAPQDAPLTERQRQIYRFICDTVQEEGYAPTLREIGHAVGMTSVSGVAHQLRQLAAKGYITLDPGRMRAYRVITRPLGTAQSLAHPQCGCSPRADDNEEGGGAPLVLKVMITPGMKDALVNGATLNVRPLLMPDTNCSSLGSADILGQVTAITHSVNDSSESPCVQS